jgi:hypothetical protein
VGEAVTARIGACLRCGSSIVECECAARASSLVEAARERITSAQIVVGELIARTGDGAVRVSRAMLQDLSLLHSLALAQLRGVDGKTS